MNQGVVSRYESVDLIKSIIMMCLFILSTIQGSSLGQLLTLPTCWMDGNSELRIECDMHATQLMITFLRRIKWSQRSNNHSHFTNHSHYLRLGEFPEPPITGLLYRESDRCHYAIATNQCLHDWSQYYELSTQPFIHEYQWCHNKINTTTKRDPIPHQNTPYYHPSVHHPQCHKKYTPTMQIVEQLSRQGIPSSQWLVCSWAAAFTLFIWQKACSWNIQNVIVLA